MRLGLFMMPIHPPTRTLSAYMAEAAEKSLLAERLGFDELWLGEHFSASSEPIPSPLMFMASLIPQTRRFVFGTGVINLPNRHPAVDCRRSGAVRSHEQRPLHVRHRHRQPAVGLRAVQRSRRSAASPHAGRIDRDDRAHLGAGPALRVQGRVLELRHPARHQPGARHRLYAKAASQERPANLHFGIEPEFKHRPPGRLAGLGADLERADRSRLLGQPLGGLQEGCLDGGRVADGQDWRIVRCVLVAGSDAEARSRVFSMESAYRYYFSYLFNVLKRANRIASLKPRPDMPDDGGARSMPSSRRG